MIRDFVSSTIMGRLIAYFLGLIVLTALMVVLALATTAVDAQLDRHDQILERSAQTVAQRVQEAWMRRDQVDRVVEEASVMSTSYVRICKPDN